MEDQGRILREVRTSAGVSLRSFAKQARLDVGYLSRIERGLQGATAQVVAAYETAFGDVVDRRDLLRGVTATFVTPATTLDMIFHGFSNALSEPRGEQYWLHRIDQYGRDYMTVGARGLQRRVLRDLIEIQAQMDTGQHWVVAAKLMMICGKALPPRGTGRRNPEALNWYRLSAKAADRSGDVNARIWVRGRAALALAYEGSDIDAANALARNALQISDTPTMGLLTAQLAGAHVAGCYGNVKQAIGKLVDAKRTLDALDVDEGENSEFNIPGWRMSTFESMLLSRLGHRRSVNAQDEADHARPRQFARFSAHINLHRGLMLVKSGDLIAGVNLARDTMAKLPAIQRNHSLCIMHAEIERHAEALLKKGPHRG